MSRETERINHPAFGQIAFTRTTGRNNFYGSELEQDHYISMEIKHSEIERDLTCDRFFNTSEPSIIRVRMTANQFSEMITNMNNGSGVPCTIERIQGKKVQDLQQQESRKEFVHRKFEDRMKNFAKRILEDKERAKEIIKKKNLSKTDISQLSMSLDYIIQEVTQNIPFFAKCYQETIDEMVLDAKTEVENAITHKISVLGLKALHEKNNSFIDLGSNENNDNNKPIK